MKLFLETNLSAMYYAHAFFLRLLHAKKAVNENIQRNLILAFCAVA
jgi:hypothetical protein